MQTIDKIMSDKDIKVLKDVSSGSYALTFFIEKNGKHYYRKLATSKTGGVDKLRAQLEFILQYGKQLKMPDVSCYYVDEDCCYFDMLSDSKHMSFFDYVALGDADNSYRGLMNILQNIVIFHKTHKIESNGDALSQYIKTKIFDNVDFIEKNGGEYLSKLVSYKTIIINGKEYENLDYYFGENGILTYDELYNIFKDDVCSVIHGDFTIDNIVYSEEVENGTYLIDPNVGNLHQTMFLDYSKLLQSLHSNYEFYCHTKEFSIKDNQIEYDLGNTYNYENLYKKYDNFLRDNFSKGEYKSIYAHELVHWLRLMPYKINKNKKTAVLFYAQLLIALKEFVTNFKEI